MNPDDSEGPTPGPWKWLTTDKFFSLIVEGPERFEIEGPLPYLDREINPTADRMFADARLIAAAPLLLAEVKRLEKRQSALLNISLSQWNIQRQKSSGCVKHV